MRHIHRFLAPGLGIDDRQSSGPATLGHHRVHQIVRMQDGLAVDFDDQDTGESARAAALPASTSATLTANSSLNSAISETIPSCVAARGGRRRGSCGDGCGRCVPPNATWTGVSRPVRESRMVSSRVGPLLRTLPTNCSGAVIGTPSASTITSPGSSPAFSAGLPGRSSRDFHADRFPSRTDSADTPSEARGRGRRSRWRLGRRTGTRRQARPVLALACAAVRTSNTTSEKGAPVRNLLKLFGTLDRRPVHADDHVPHLHTSLMRCACAARRS